MRQPQRDEQPDAGDARREDVERQEAIDPANPTSAPERVGTEFETLCAPDMTLSAAPVFLRKPQGFRQLSVLRFRASGGRKVALRSHVLQLVMLRSQRKLVRARTSAR